MGYTTDYVGHITIDPPLNEAGQSNLSAFAHSRRYARRAGPYALPANAEDREKGLPADAYNRVADGQHSMWCQWVPCVSGCCVAFNGLEKFYGGPSWLGYLG